MNIQDPQLVGPIIGGVIAIVAATATSLITQIFASRRHKSQLAHDREQEIRGRRTTALEDLLFLLEEQVAALQDLEGFLNDPNVRPHLKISPEEAWKTLKERNYRRKLWPRNIPLSRAINEYATKTEELLSSLRQQEIAELCAGKINCLNKETRIAVRPKFQEAITPLSTARKETINLISELNDIRLLKRAT